MKLLIDIGNTRIKWAFDDGDSLVAAGETVHRGNRAGPAVEFIAALELVPDAAFAVNVAGPAMEKVLADGLRTADLLGEEGTAPVSTGEMGDAIVAALD